MPFNPRTFQEILTDMVTMVRTNTTITDFNRGSVIRTILEAAALEDDEQYYQMIQILRTFSYRTAPGIDLDRRAADFDITRKDATPSTGQILYMDSNLVRSYLVSDIVIGTTTLTVENASVFSGIPTPFNIRLAEGDASEEVVACSAVNVTTNQLTVGATVNSHTGVTSLPITALGEFSLGVSRVAHVDGSPDRTLNSGALVGAPAVGELPEVQFLVAGVATLTNGNYLSSLVPARSTRSGLDANVGPQRIINFPAGVPFSGALVINPEATGGGSSIETDGRLAERISDTLAGLSKGTISAIRTELQKVQVPSTLQRVSRTYVHEEFVHDPTLPPDGLVRVYVEDGSGAFSAEISTPALGNLSIDAPVGSLTFGAHVTEGTFLAAGHLIIESAAPEIVEYVSADFTVTPAVFNITDIGPPLVAGDPPALLATHTATTNIRQIEEVYIDTEAGRRFYQLGNIAVVEGTLRLYKREVVGGTTTVTLMVLNTDYYLNEGTGQIEIIAGSELIAGSRLYALYDDYDGLIELAQRTLDGDARNPVLFPGVRAAGIKALVLPAERELIDVILALNLEEGYSLTAAIERADRVVRNYINSLEVGEDFIIHEMVERVMGLSGMYDVDVMLPATNIFVDFKRVPVPGTIVIS